MPNRGQGYEGGLDEDSRGEAFAPAAPTGKQMLRPYRDIQP
jgi:hypothetical protein